tara:strand:+ start:65 stop:355 length:291 start_codon:yes stop_codon:yes gene_type:complete
MNTLTIPTPKVFLVGVTNPKDLVIDIAEITFLQQVNTTSTTIFTESTTSGTITLTHGAAANGAMGDALNKALLNSNGANAVAVLPTGVDITNVAYA